jgi:hypothetical protein
VLVGREKCKSTQVRVKLDITEGIERSLNIKWEGEKMEQVEENEYLGTIISVIGNIDTEINNRV